MASPSRSVLLLHGVQSSRTTWWRLAADLSELGWHVEAFDLLGHGERSAIADQLWTMDDLAADVRARVTGPVDVLAGHSLGALVSLTALAQQPDFARAVFLEDPPGFSPGVVTSNADGITQSVARARSDPSALTRQLLTDNPRWSPIDADNAVASRRTLDVEWVTSSLRAAHWDLPALVSGCPVPIQLLLATQPGTALIEPDRSTLQSLLPAERVQIVESGHSVHRDRPALWLNSFLSFAAASL